MKHINYIITNVIIIILISSFNCSLSLSNPIDVTVKGVDNGIKSTKQQDYIEAVTDAKSQAIERAGVEITSLTNVENYELKLKIVESASEGVLHEGYNILDLGYQVDGTYLVVLSGRVSSNKVDDNLSKKFRLAEMKMEKGKINEARDLLGSLAYDPDSGELAAKSLYYLLMIDYRSEDTYMDRLDAYHPDSPYRKKAREFLNLLRSTRSQYIGNVGNETRTLSGSDRKIYKTFSDMNGNSHNIRIGPSGGNIYVWIDDTTFGGYDSHLEVISLEFNNQILTISLDWNRCASCSPEYYWGASSIISIAKPLPLDIQEIFRYRPRDLHLVSM